MKQQVTHTSVRFGPSMGSRLPESQHEKGKVVS